MSGVPTRGCAYLFYGRGVVATVDACRPRRTRITIDVVRMKGSAKRLGFRYRVGGAELR
jgi:hypothetical protein